MSAALYSPLEAAKDRLTIPELWARLGLPGEPRRHGRSPFREDRSPSFSIFAGGRRWRDFATGAGGDAADFLACALELSPGEGVRKLIEMAGISQNNDEPFPLDRSVRDPAKILNMKSPTAEAAWAGKAAAQSEKATKRARWPVLEACSEEEIAAIAERRGLSVEGVTLAAQRGLLWMADSREGRAWVITDSRRVNAQARRLDGLSWERISAKAWTLPGSEASWPVGLSEAAACPAIALVEGGPDLLAACHLIAQSAETDLIAPVAMLGAGQAIPHQAAPLFAGKRVRIFAHADPAGQQAARRWWAQIRNSAGYVDGYTATGGDLNDFVRDAAQDHAEALAFTRGLPPRRESPEDAESRRIARELVLLQRAGAIEGPDDPEAAIFAATMRLFGARFADRQSLTAIAA